MGATLNITAASDGYTLVDRGAWAAFGNRGTLRALCEGEPALYNPYGLLLPSPARNPHLKREDAEAFIDWMTSAAGRAAIAGFRIGGEQVFFPPAIAGNQSGARPD